ncbi:unnamed protein product [Phytophthora fragariaefolia]|uniref:Unnamed protein product n=1 Tax=Phytophthora fragariaefolia TaxID=1490495 RepID=A0A9W6X7S1_9STRA|nr:unnamed protein product [Phytophthora fragariaefolia]
MCTTSTLMSLSSLSILSMVRWSSCSTVRVNSDRKNAIEVPVGPGDETAVVEVPRWPAVDSLPNVLRVKQKPQHIAVDTSTGPVIVTIDGPVINGKQEVTITDNKGSSMTTKADVTPTGDGNTDIDIPLPNGQSAIVNIPPTKTVTEIDVITNDGPAKVTFEGPITEGKQEVTITTSDGNKASEVVDVQKTADGNERLDITTSDGSQIAMVTVPQSAVQVIGDSEGSQRAQKTIAVDTPDGPVAVTIEGPVVDGKQQVTITDSAGNSNTTVVDTTQTSEGTQIDIPTSNGETSTSVTISQPATPSGGPAEGGTGPAATEPPVFIDTPQGPATLTTNGQVVDGKQDVTITTSTGTVVQTTATVTETSGSTNTIEIPTGPGGQTTTATVSSDTQAPPQAPSGNTNDILQKLGGGDIDNGDKDFMTKDEFQLQIGSHFAEKIKALKEQARAEDTESYKILKQQQKLENCILEASSKVCRSLMCGCGVHSFADVKVFIL